MILYCNECERTRRVTVAGDDRLCSQGHQWSVSFVDRFNSQPEAVKWNLLACSEHYRQWLKVGRKAPRLKLRSRKATRKENETMEFQFEEFEVIPEGVYDAVFEGAEEFQSEHKEYGPAVIFSFRIQSGEHEGKLAESVCSQKMTPKSRLTGMAKGLGWKEGKFQTDDYKGKLYSIVVKEYSEGKTRVDTCICK